MHSTKNDLSEQLRVKVIEAHSSAES